MSWAGERRFLITATGASLIVFVLAIILVPTLYQSPSCTDNAQNQDEQGVDCGGSCARLCTALTQAPVVRFTKAVFPATNRVDVIAYVDNPNPEAAARAVPYTVTLYGADQTILKTGSGTIDLPPLRSTPVFIPAFFTGNNIAGVRAFLTIDATTITWYRSGGSARVPRVASPTIAGTENAPRVTATLSNSGIVPFSDVRVVAIVYDASGTVIAASQTLVSSIAGQGEAVATFTWSTPFSGVPARIEIVPLPTLSGG